MTWKEIVKRLHSALATRGLSEVYQERLKFEIAEVEKQGAESIWINRVADGKRFAANPNNLLIPWLLDMVDGDPIVSRSSPMLNTVRASKVLGFKEQNGFVPHDLLKDPDSPDIDIDCLPIARDPLKQFAIEKYGQNFGDGYGSVCSVGTWQTYKFKSALIDSAVALDYIPRGIKGKGKKKNVDVPVDAAANQAIRTAENLNKELPDDVDELKEDGKAACKGIDSKTGKECGFLWGGYDDYKAGVKCCPKCQATDTDGPNLIKLFEEFPEQFAKFRQICDDGRAEAIARYEKKRAEDPTLTALDEKDWPDIFDVSTRLIGRIRNMGMHAGAIIITNRPLYGNIPLSKSGRKGYWVSMWTEGRSPQLSKFGYIKWDLLGLKTLEYIFNCCKLIEDNRGISFGKNMEGMEHNNPHLRQAGYYFDGAGNKQFINMDDPHALKVANEQKTDGVFQFDTELAKCVCFDSNVLTDAGPVPIAKLDPRHHKIAYAADSGPKFTSQYEVKSSGAKPLKRIALDDGRILRVTAEHRVLTRSRGYVTAAELRVGDDIVEIDRLHSESQAQAR